MAQIGLGFYAGVPGWAPALAGSGWQLLADPPSSNPLPGARIIGRVMPPGLDGWEWDCVTRGQDGLEEYVQFCLPHWQRSPYVECWTGPNEPPANTVADAELLSGFYAELCPTAKAFGVKIAGGCFSRGRPDENILGGYVPMLRALANIGGYLAVHEYGLPPKMDNPVDVGWHCLRYRRWLPFLRLLPALPLLCTELGIDDNASGGYAAHGISSEEYLRQLGWWAQQTQEDPAMLAGLIFAGTAYGFGSFIVGENIARGAAQINAALAPAPPPQPEPAPAPVTVQPKLLWPIASGGGQVTQEFGCDKRWGTSGIDYSWVKYKQPNNTYITLAGHNGRDIAAPKGTPVIATHSGQAWCYQDPGFGNTVELWAPSVGKASVYKTISAHLDRIVAVDKRFVRAGEVIGYVGSTGNSTGNHLHYGIKFLQASAPAYNGWVDPRPFMGR